MGSLESHKPGGSQVVFQGDEKTFQDFIKGLLGKPQTLTIERHGVFHLNRDQLANIFYAIDQRIKQQNKAFLASFGITIAFDDGTSETLSDIESFIAFNEVKPVVSESVTLALTYLVEFPERPNPERQQIDITFARDSSYLTEAQDGIVIRRSMSFGSRGFVAVRIAHTAKTWGVDIESLIKNLVGKRFVARGVCRRLVNSNIGKITFLSSLLLFVFLVSVSFYASSGFEDTYFESYESLIGEGGSIEDKLDYMVKANYGGLWFNYYYWSSVSIFIFMILSFIGGALTFASLLDRAKSHVCITEKSIESYDQEYKNSVKSRWKSFVLWLLTLGTGLLVNYIFYILVTK